MLSHTPCDDNIHARATSRPDHGSESVADDAIRRLTVYNPHPVGPPLTGAVFMLPRHARIIGLAVLILAPAVLAQVPAASDPPKYTLPPPHIVAAFDAEPLPQVLVSPNRQVL